jgi:glycosyltransferase involved in cell wall biosynthesis
MKIALIGTRGVPARYGGFETCVEEVGQRLAAAGHEVVVYCRPDAGSGVRPGRYLGMELVHLPVVRRRSVETLAHTTLSVLHRSLRGTDAAIVFNAANSPLLPVINARRIPVATHVDGLEWLRGKWGPVGQRYYRAAEALAVRWSDALIADAQGIQDYYATEFSAPTELIAYGAPILTDPGAERVRELELEPRRYHLVVARFEPENHVREIVQGYVASAAELPLVVVGSAPYADGYTAEVAAAADDRVRMLGGLWDQDQVNQLYANAASYLHGHSVGGTNPSLLRAAGAGTFTIAFDVGFNREVLGAHGAYFDGPSAVTVRLMETEADLSGARSRGEALQQNIRRYNWDDVAERYEKLCRDLAEGGYPRKRPSGRRSGRWELQPSTSTAEAVRW